MPFAANMSVRFFFFQAEDGIRDSSVTGVQTCALPIFGKMYRIGALTAPATMIEPDRSAFFDGMHAHGWIEGQNCVVEHRSHGGAMERGDGLTRELIGLNVDALLVWCEQVAIAARRVSR